MIRLVVSVEICCDDRSAELECEVVWFRSLMTILFAALLNVWVLNKRNFVHGRLSQHCFANELNKFR